MSLRTLELGAVFQPEWDARPIRVLAFDANEVMYDVWWPHKNAWGFSGFKGTASYYRIPTAFLVARAEYVRTDPYSEAEAELHRPELPFSFGRCAALNWTSVPPASIAEMATKLRSVGCGTSEKNSVALLAASSVYLSPFGPKDGAKPGTLVKAQDGRSFTEAELLRHAWQLQAPYLREPLLTKGIGLYRSGVQRKVPSYYIWGARSRSEGSGENEG